ncbi:hypothetical protein [Absidia glauca]|uniref:F-box domain-containing protein n=1 Tax=Absidia glauca TaxID=4829 RepID=A0A163KBN4_ABSGL|nr:hypothetical protein [Absidia glauca]
MGALYAASTPLLWQRPICPEPAWALGKKALSLLSCLRPSPRPAYLGQYKRRLDLHGSDAKKQVVPFMSCMPLLHNLRLSAPSDPVSHPCHSIYHILYDILPHYPRLERLLLSKFEISNSTLVNISQWCNQIHVLELHNCAGFTTDALTTLLTGYRTCLTSLTLLVNDGWKAHLGRTLDRSQLQQLTSLSVYRCLAIDNGFLCRPLATHLTAFRITQCNVDLGHTPELLLRFLRAHP